MLYQIDKKYKNVWNAAFEYQDFRNDKGHAFIVSVYAKDICEKEGTDPDVVIPAAILHDIGWSQLAVDERMSVFKHGVDKSERFRIRIAHQETGAKLAKEILKEVEYPKELIDEILEIISQHDTREGFLSDNEGAMRDADKFWRFDDYGFLNDNMNSGISFTLEIEGLKKKLEDPLFLHFESSKQRAFDMLEKLDLKYID